MRALRLVDYDGVSSVRGEVTVHHSRNWSSCRRGWCEQKLQIVNAQRFAEDEDEDEDAKQSH